MLREVEERLGFVQQFAQCFDDYRNFRFSVHSWQALLRKPIVGIAWGCEDLNDHDLV